jgi:hypothetical protein
MPEFLLRYKVDPHLDLETDISAAVRHADNMAIQVATVASEIFGMPVCWEVREFGHSQGMPNFYVTGWITDNDDVRMATVHIAQSKILEVMQSLTPQNEVAACWLIRVKAKFGQANGRIPLK